MSGLAPLLDVTVSESQKAYEQFFQCIDSRSMPPPALQPNTKIVWNGSPLAGRDAFMSMLAQMPTTKHEITGFNVHPFPNGDANALNMMMDTSGRVQFGNERGANIFAFQATFVLRRAGAGAPLVTEQLVYRLVYKPADATISI